MIYRVDYTDEVPIGKAGIAKLWFIKIRPSHMDDKGLFAHELEHVRQFWMFSLFHCLAYGRLDSYTLWCEVQAYRKQLEHSPECLDRYAGYIANDYGLSVTKEEAKKLLRGG
jgi:hypothetical protein